MRIYSPTGGLFPDPGVHFHAGLSDVKAIVGEPAEIECKVSSEECEGFWYKDGEEVSPWYRTKHKDVATGLHVKREC